MVNAFTKLPASQPVTAFVYLPLNNAQGELALCKVKAPKPAKTETVAGAVPTKFVTLQLFCAHGVHDFEDPPTGESIVMKGLQGENPCNIFSVNVHYYTFGHS